MNSFTGIFQGFNLDFKDSILSPPCSLDVLTQALPPNFEEPSHMFSIPVGKPAHFLEFISHNTFSGSYNKIILHNFSESISNNIDTSKVTPKQYSKIILFYNSLSNLTDIFRELLPNTTNSF